MKTNGARTQEYREKLLKNHDTTTTLFRSTHATSQLIGEMYHEFFSCLYLMYMLIIITVEISFYTKKLPDKHTA